MPDESGSTNISDDPTQTSSTSAESSLQPVALDLPQESPETDRLPVDPTTGQLIPPRAQPGYYPGYHTLDLQNFWDAATREVVLKRVSEVPPIRFFDTDELELMNAIIGRVLPQDDRDDDHKIPIVPIIDEKLYTGKSDGYRYEDMPPDEEAYRLGLKGIQAIAQHMYGRSFLDLDPLEQDLVLETLHDADPPAGDEIWRQVPILRWWQLLVGDACAAYYAHPWAWDEVGFGGPAYPRGYFRLRGGEPEPWEVDEQRYAWAPPPRSISGQFKPLGGPHAKHPPPGQAGTH